MVSGAWIFLLFFLAAIPIAYSAQQEVVHKPQKYKISRLSAWVLLFVSLSIVFAIYFKSPLFILLYSFGVLGFVFACWMFSKMSKSMLDIGEIDAITWLWTTTPPQHPATFFKKAGQMTGDDSIGRHYRPRLLESLMRFLTLLITSHHVPEPPSSDSPNSPSSSLGIVKDPHLKNLEIYIACLARLSEFADYKGNFWILREDAMRHSKLEQPLIDKLVVLADPGHRFDDLRSAAAKVLKNYELDMEGKPLMSPATVVWSVSTVLKSTVSSVAAVLRSVVSLVLSVRGRNTSSSQEEQGLPSLRRPVELATLVKPPHSLSEIEEA